MLPKLECSPESGWREKAQKVFSSICSFEVVINVIGGAELCEVHIPRYKRLSMKTIAN
jgi:hypothetical protein